MKGLIVAIILAAIGAMPACAASWQADGKTSALGFIGMSQGAAFDGRFKSFRADIDFDPAYPDAAHFAVKVDLASADSANSERDSTLHGPDFFAATRYPTATWTATKAHSLGGNRYVADGTLNLRGVSKPVRFTFTWTVAAKPTLVGETTINRLDFGIGGGQWADTSVIANAVKVQATLHLAPASR